MNRWLAYNADLTLGEATEMPDWACACLGPPFPSPPGTPCSCRLTWMMCDELQRAAHIVVKMVGEVARRQG